jgi:DUF1365 family protein
MVLVDVDRVAEQMRVSPFTSLNRFNWATFDDRDHLGDPARPLRERLKSDAAAHGITLPAGPIYLLTHLRYLGYNFNPISFYFCYDDSGRLDAVLAEVRNTFGEMRSYWTPPAPARETTAARRWRASKTMHVSPFMTMAVDYEFSVTPPGSSLVAHMTTTDRHDEARIPDFDATLTLARRPWTAGALHRVLLRHPWMTAKVITSIHWEAVRLWWKGVPFHSHPGAPAAPREDSESSSAGARVRGGGAPRTLNEEGRL